MTSKSAVFVWRRNWLPGSETFIRNQVEALSRWQGLCVGIAKRESPLARDTDRVLSSGGLRARVAWFTLVLAGASSKLSKLVRSQKPTIIHAHFAGDARGVDLFAARHGLPLVITAHGSEILTAGSMTGLGGWFYRITTRRALRRANVVLVLTEFMRAAVLDFEPRARVRVHPTGVAALDMADAGIGYDVLFVGRLEPVKGPQVVLNVAESLHRSGHRVRVGMVGDGSMRDDLERLASEKGLEVDWLGLLPQGTVLSLMRNSKVLLAPSSTQANGSTEAFGMVFLEAASQETPCVAYLTGGVSEAIADGVTGLLVPEADEEALASATLQLLSDSETRLRMGRAGRVRLLDKFDIVAWTEKLELLYDEILQSHRSARL